MQSLTLVVDDATALRGLYDDHLSKGRAFVLGDHDVTERAPCELVLQHASRAYRLVAEVVHVRREDPGRGVGLQLARLDTTGAAALLAFVDGTAGEEVVETPAASDRSAEQPSAQDEEAPAESQSAEGAAAAESLQDRVRGLSGAEQLKLAAAGTLAERTTLERLYGPTVWETLLRNPRLTVPEAARIGRKANLPRPMVELIAGNPTWLASGEVQRALLSNPRSSPTVVQKVLSAMSRHDLQLVPQQTAYPEPVRAAAKKRLGR